MLLAENFYFEYLHLKFRTIKCFNHDIRLVIKKYTNNGNKIYKCSADTESTDLHFKNTIYIYNISLCMEIFFSKMN